MELFPDHEFEPKPEANNSALKPVELPKPPKITTKVKEKLVKLAFEVQKLEPWLEVHESELFGIEDPQTGLVHWCSVLGGGTTVFSIQFHEPPEAIDFWNQVFQGQPPKLSSGMAQIRLVECEFASIQNAEDEDKAFIKAVGKLPSKATLIPCFRSFLPGFVPWFVDQDDAKRLCLFLELFLKFFEELNPKYSLYHEVDEAGIHYPVFRLTEKGSAKNMKDWKVKKELFPEPSSMIVELPAPDPNLENWSKLPVKKETWEIASFYLPDPIADGPRPYFAKMPICINTTEGRLPISHSPDLYGGENPLSDTDALRGAFADTVANCNYLPSKIRVGSETALLAFVELAKSVGIELIEEPFERIDDFAREMLNMNSQQGAEIEGIIASMPPELQQKIFSGELDDQLLKQLMELMESSDERPEVGNILSIDFGSEENETSSADSSESLPELKNAEEHYRVRVTISGIKGLNRIFTLPSDATFFHLHAAIQEFFNWEDSHLFDFSIGAKLSCKTIGIIDSDLPMNTRISRFQKKDNSFEKLQYTYDYGDNWQHNISISKKLVKPKKPTLDTVLIGGKGVPPVEDCGGVGGFYALMDGCHPFCEDEPEYWKSYFENEFEASDYGSLSNASLDKLYEYALARKSFF